MKSHNALGLLKWSGVGRIVEGNYDRLTNGV